MKQQRESDHDRPRRVNTEPTPTTGGADRSPKSTAERLQHRLGNQLLQQYAPIDRTAGESGVSEPSDTVEREANRVADVILGSPSRESTTTGEGRSTPMPTVPGRLENQSSGARASGAGGTNSASRSLPENVRSHVESRTDADFGSVRIHTGSRAQALTEVMGARALTVGQNIFFGPSEYRPHTHSGRELLAHELAHAGQDLDVVARREATWLERRAWLSFYDHYLPRKFLNNYMDDTGRRITLSRKEMEDCNPIVDLRRSQAFQTALSSLQSGNGGVRVLSITGWGGAMTNGTLGNFTIHYDGTLAVQPTGGWTFIGTMWFEDYWDFNTGGPNRPWQAELKVRVANLALPGKPFPIDSVRVAVQQTDSDSRAQWGAQAPTNVQENLLGTGADIEVGAGAGGVGEVGGGEVGAQSAEDLK